MSTKLLKCTYLLNTHVYRRFTVPAFPKRLVHNAFKKCRHFFVGKTVQNNCV
nr:MAG TPA: hypothetical protein [Caudoviricetes sp.]